MLAHGAEVIAYVELAGRLDAREDSQVNLLKLTAESRKSPKRT
jgi:hypothetical protein